MAGPREESLHTTTDNTFLYPVLSSVEIDKSHQLHCSAREIEALSSNGQKLNCAWTLNPEEPVKSKRSKFTYS